jgi:hypothetical protein
MAGLRTLDPLIVVRIHGGQLEVGYINFLWSVQMYKFILAVAVISLSACAAKEEAVQGEVVADSAAVVVDSTKIDTDSIKSAEVKPAAEGEAAK